MIDTHAHLDFDRFDPDRSQVIADSLAKLELIINVGCEPAYLSSTLALANAYPTIWAALGWHPEGVQGYTDQDYVKLAKNLTHPKVVALGEIGLDYHYEQVDKDAQITCFRRQLSLAQEHNLPIIVHSREAFQDTWAALAEYRGAVVWHCFGYTLEQAKMILARGHYLSFTGNITYPKADRIREVATYAPLEQIMIETDCPFLAPQQYRGERCAPWMVLAVADQLSKLKQLSVEEIDTVTSRNARYFFKVNCKSPV